MRVAGSGGGVDNCVKRGGVCPSATFFYFFLITLEPRVEWLKSLSALTAFPQRGHAVPGLVLFAGDRLRAGWRNGLSFITSITSQRGTSWHLAATRSYLSGIKKARGN